MYIVTTKKRLQWITAGFLGALVVGVGVWVNSTYQSQVVAPEAYRLQLQEIAQGNGDIRSLPVDIESISSNERERIERQLSADLGKSNAPASEAAFQSMMVQATAHLDQEESFYSWLQWQLREVGQSSAAWEVVESEMGAQALQVGDWCLTIKTEASQWQLTALGPCLI